MGKEDYEKMNEENGVKRIFDSLKTLTELREYISDSEDGESSWLEFKALRKGEKRWGKREFENHIKSLAAKEICAFLNTNDGILCLGVAYVDKELSIINEYDGDLYSFMSKNIKDMLEPIPNGVNLKKMEDNGKEALLIFVPRSNLMPHRVWGKAESDIACNYFTRSDTDSVKLSEGLVRALYLSHGRIPRIRLYAEVEVVSANQILLRVLAKPDEVEFIDRYYDSERFLMLDGGGKLIESKYGNGVWVDIESVGVKKSIYPAKEPIILDLHSITNDYSDDSDFAIGLDGVEIEYNPLCHNTHLSITDFKSLQYILVESNFACRGVSLVKNRRLYVLPLGLGRDENEYRFKGLCGFARNAKFETLEEKYGIEVYISKYYDNNKKVYDATETATIMPSEDEVSVSLIDGFLENLEFWINDRC